MQQESALGCWAPTAKHLQMWAAASQRHGAQPTCAVLGRKSIFFWSQVALVLVIQQRAHPHPEV